MRTIYFSLFIALSSYGYTQVSVTPLRDTGLQNNYDVLPHLLIWESKHKVSVEEAYSKVLLEGITRHSSNLGYSNNEYWVLFSVINASDELAQRLLEIGNPQIDSVTVYRIVQDSIPKIWTRTGDAFAFHKRLIDHRNFLFPLVLRADEEVTLLVKLNKRYSSLTVPFQWWHTSSYFEVDNKKLLGYGFYFGFLGLCFIYASLTFYFLRNPIYFWYAAWVLITALFVATSIGLSFQFIYPTLTINSHIRVIILILSLFTFIMFAQKFLHSSMYAPRLHQTLTIIAYLSLGLIPLGLIAQSIYPSALVAFLGIIYVLTVSSMGIILVISVISYSKQKVVVLFYYLAFGTIIISGLSIIYGEFGFSTNKNLGINPYMIGSAIELLVFSIALTYQIKQLYEERNLLSVRILNQQKEMLSAYVNGIERERERISLELHDDIGSRLSNLKRFIKESTKDGVRLDEQIDGICSDVRNLSHQLAPPSLQHNTLIKLISELAEKTARVSRMSVHVQEYDFPEKLPDSIQTSLFRIIQEALENSAKHAGATEVDIQFFGYDSDLVITYEDNGDGFDVDRQLEGIGLKNIRTRVESLEGKFEIQSGRAAGTILIIQIPWQEISQVSSPK